MYLAPGDKVEIIAPASRCHPNVVNNAIQFLKSWQLEPVVHEPLFGDDLLCAINEQQRFENLYTALTRLDTKAVWALLGGYGCSPLLPVLAKQPKPMHKKLIMGFSDITALHIFVQQQWGWDSIHTPSLRQLALNKLNEASIIKAQQLLFSNEPYTLSLTPANTLAKRSTPITGIVTGGNATLVQVSLATSWQIQTNNKILLIEEVNEAAYRIDRMFNQFHQSGLFDSAKALLLGDFTAKTAEQNEAQIKAVLSHWADKLTIPVYYLPGVGHSHHCNYSIPLGRTGIIDPLHQHIIFQSANE